MPHTDPGLRTLRSPAGEHDASLLATLARHLLTLTTLTPHTAPALFCINGIGTGINGSEVDCRLGSHAYPVLIRNDMMSYQNDCDKATTFQHLSCTGSTIQDVLAGGDHSQVDLFNTTTSSDFALLSIGGNDLGFFDIMNSCIFRFYSIYSGTCEAALERSEAQVAGPEFDQHLRLLIMEILNRVLWEKRPWFTITVTGYARFFNADTPDCDDYTLGMWWHGPKLKQDLRMKMNRMVINVNRRLEQAIRTINEAFTEPRVLFVDYDDVFEGHRFCEPGVVELDYLRNETWFFLVGGDDNDGSTMPREPLPSNAALNDSSHCARTKAHMAIRDRVYQTWRDMDILSTQPLNEEL
ncbi:hypothetical protein MY4038_006780 [Beauveria bassiana]